MIVSGTTKNTSIDVAILHPITTCILNDCIMKEKKRKGGSAAALFVTAHVGFDKKLLQKSLLVRLIIFVSQQSLPSPLVLVYLYMIFHLQLPVMPPLYRQYALKKSFLSNPFFIFIFKLPLFIHPLPLHPLPLHTHTIKSFPTFKL